MSILAANRGIICCEPVRIGCVSRYDSLLPPCVYCNIRRIIPLPHAPELTSWQRGAAHHWGRTAEDAWTLAVKDCCSTSCLTKRYLNGSRKPLSPSIALDLVVLSNPLNLLHYSANGRRLPPCSSHGPFTITIRLHLTKQLAPLLSSQ